MLDEHLRSFIVDNKIEQSGLAWQNPTGDIRVQLDLDDLTFLLGPNGAGKTAVLQV